MFDTVKHTVSLLGNLNERLEWLEKVREAEKKEQQQNIFLKKAKTAKKDPCYFCKKGETEVDLKPRYAFGDMFIWVCERFRKVYQS